MGAEMKRPIVSLLIVILSGLLFPSCYKNDLRALYERWVNQVTLSGLHEDSTKKFKEVISKVSVEVGEGLEPKEEELRTIYVPSNTDAVITFKLNNQKKYYILPVLACEGLSPNIIAPASAEITDEITVTLAKAFLADNVGSFFDGTITLQEWGKDSLSTQKIRDFDKKINFRIIINLPPQT